MGGGVVVGCGKCGGVVLGVVGVFGGGIGGVGVGGCGGVGRGGWGGGGGGWGGWGWGGGSWGGGGGGGWVGGGLGGGGGEQGGGGHSSSGGRITSTREWQEILGLTQQFGAVHNLLKRTHKELEIRARRSSWENHHPDRLQKRSCSLRG